MKKILALILALLMIATMVALSACGKDDDEEPNNDDDYEYSGDESRGSDAQDDEDTDEKDDDVVLPEETEWIKKSDYICTGVNGVVLREGPGVDYEQVKTLKAGEKLKRTGTNGRWNKVTVDGETYYVSTSYTTVNVNDFVFEEYAAEEQVLLNVKEECQINLRSTPFYTDADAEANILFSGFASTETDEDGESLKLIAVSKSGTWYKVSFTGSWGSKTYTDKICYVKNTDAVVDAVDGLPSNGASNNATFG